MSEGTARERMLDALKKEPELSNAELARRLGVSRERVRQIAQSEGIALSKEPSGYTARHRRAASVPHPRIRTGGVPTRLNQTVVGTIGELLAAADLSARGFAVFFPFIRTAVCDLVAVGRRGTALRVEVRCGHRRNGRVVFAQKTKDTADHYAVVLTGEPVTYEPELPEPWSV